MNMIVFVKKKNESFPIVKSKKYFFQSLSSHLIYLFRDMLPQNSSFPQPSQYWDYICIIPQLTNNIVNFFRLLILG